MGSSNSTTALQQDGVYRYTRRYQGAEVTKTLPYPFETKSFAELLRNAASDCVFIHDDDWYVMTKNIILRVEEYETMSWITSFRPCQYAIVAYEERDGTISHIYHFAHHDVYSDIEFLETLGENELVDYMQRGDIHEAEFNCDMKTADRSGSVKKVDSLYYLLRDRGCMMNDAPFFDKSLTIVYLYHNHRWDAVYNNSLYSLEEIKEM